MNFTNQRFFVFVLIIFLFVFNINTITHALPVCDRTTQVRDAIVTAAGVASCSDVTDTHLAAITRLNLDDSDTDNIDPIQTLQNGDFAGLTALTSLSIDSNSLTWLPEDVFDGLSALTDLSLDGNPISWLYADIFDGLTALTNLSLDNTALAWLHADQFDGLSALTALSLDSNSFTWLPSGLFDGLSALTTLSLSGNNLTWLPNGLFDGLNALTSLDMSGNTNSVTDESVTLWTSIGLEKVGVGQFKATADTGAPFDIVVPISVTNGSITSGVSTLTISKGSLSSGTVTVTRTSGTTTAVIATIGTLPTVPSSYSGYVLASSAYLPLTVYSAFMNDPVFTEGVSTTRSIAENSAAGQNIGDVVSATDADEGDMLTYSLGGTDASSFGIDSSTGQLKTYAALDYETKSSYSVLVSVSDSSGIGTDTITVTINVTDVNDAPMFDEGENATRSVVENTSAGENIGSAVVATDQDNGDTLTYTLSGTDAASFDIVSTSGQLQTKAALDYENDTSYEVVITVSDDDSGSLSDTITVTIEVTNVNDVAPVFTEGEDTTRTIADNTATNTTIGDPVSATDQDNDTLMYSLGGTDAASFSIVSTTGQLKTLSAINIQTKSSYEVEITVSDGSFTDTITVTIIVLTDVCSRTQQVRDAIVAAAGVADCADVTYEHLSAITSLDLSSQGITSLQLHDFNGLTALTSLSLSDNDLSWLHGNGFAGLSALTSLSLANNDITWLPNNPFAGLSALTSLSLANNQLSWLPNDIFDGLSSLTSLDMDGNTNALWTTIALEKVGVGQFKATAHTGAPFDIVVPISVTNGSIPTGVSTLTIPQGSIESASLTATRNSGTAAAVNVNIGTLPSIPSGHNGYGLSPSTDLPLQIISESVNAPEFTEGENTTRSIAENTAAEQYIGDAVEGTDADEYDTLTYSLGGTDAASFDIDSSTGQLKTKAALDHETKSSYTVTISVSDDANNGTDTITVTISVTDVNDMPVFTDGSTATREIAENTVSGENIGDAIGATDQDEDTLTYSLGGTDAASFGIDTETGQLKTDTSLDYETKQSYTVTISVSDDATNSLSATTTVTINVTNVNDVAPMFTDGEDTTREIAENTAAGENIGSTVGATDGENDVLIYSLGGTDDASFDIDSGNGQLKTKASLDYETKQSYTVTITVSDRDVLDADKLTDTITVTINILDVDDNRAPVFTEGSTATRSIAENTASSQNIGSVVGATDQDSDDTLTYSLGGTDAASFSIVNSSGQLKTKTALNYETKRSYAVTITVTDSGNLTDTIDVTINVTNVNDVAPEFTDGSTATREIAENSIAGVNIGSAVAATDGDSETLTYSLGGTDAASFDIDSSSGQLKTKDALDYEDVDSYEVTITAADGDTSEKLTDTITVTISVTDANDAPVFTDGTTTTREVAENTAADENIGGVIGATDQDEDTLEYSLGGTDAASFAIDTETGQLKTKAALDYENVTSYEVVITVSDDATNSLSTTTTVTINVTNVNDVAPEFTDGSTTTREIAENSIAGVNIGSAVAATDGDSETLTYTLSGTDASSFDIDSETGQLKTKDVLDYEDIDSYEVTITVADGDSSDKLTDTINVNINVTNVNEAPAFSSVSTTRSVAENTPANQNIGSVVGATDVDAGDTLTYTLGGTNATSFSIVGSSGQLKTKTALNYETKQAYAVTITVTDSGNLTDTINVTINVTNVNDVAPVFTDGNTTTRSIAENTRAGVNIGRAVGATDGDSTSLSYSLSGTDRTSFGIDSTSGQLKTKAALNYENKSSYAVIVTASDGNLSDTINVTINVTNVNEAPVFSNGVSTTRSVAENTPANRNIGSVVGATDVDAGDTLRYTLGGTNGTSFNIVTTTGQLQTKAALNYETKQAYAVTITVTDSGNLTDTIGVTINVTNVNEAPVFTEGDSTTRSIAENSAANVYIGNAVSATDVDTGDTLEYSLGGTDHTSFSIDSANGQLKTKAALDHDTKAIYSVTITVSDRNNSDPNKLTDTIDVTINVTNVNEAPVFTEGDSTTRSVVENTGPYVSFGNPISATDQDGDTLTYSFGGFYSGQFSVNSSTGQLSTSYEPSLDYETQTSYSVTITATDGNGGSATTTLQSILSTLLCPLQSLTVHQQYVMLL